MLSITALDKDSIRRIHTGQVITSTESIVKELLENSLDASASAIDVRLVNEGLQKIEVRDNGSGIGLHDRSNMAKQHYTSKLTSFANLDRVETYGFRGEALSSLCEISGEVYITTKTKHDTVAICYKLDRNGNILSENASGSIPQTGTMVSIYQPFAHLPVRRQFAEKNKTNGVKRIHELMLKYGLSHPLTRLSLNQQQNTLGKSKGQPVWIKPSTTSLTEGVRIIYGATLASMVEECSFEENFDQQVDPNDTPVPNPIRLHCILPSISSDPSQIFRGERVFIFVDKRPINYAKSDLKELVAMVRQRYKRCLGLEDDTKKIPFMYIDIQTGFGGYDVNIEPDKSVVLVVWKNRLMDVMQELLDQIYGGFFNNQTSLPSAERYSTRSNLTIQEVPCHFPEHSPNSIPQSSPSPSMEVDSPILDNTFTDFELDETGDNLHEPATANPPLPNDYLQHHLSTNNVYEKPTSTNQSLIQSRNQQRLVDESANLDCQIDEASDTTSTAPASPTQIQQRSPHHSHEHSNQLSNWFAKFRRPSTSSNHNATKQPATNHYPTSSTLPPAKRLVPNHYPSSSTTSQTKRPRIQASLPFTQSHSTTAASPIVLNTSASAHTVSPQQSPTTTNTSPPFSSPVAAPPNEMYRNHSSEPISPPIIPTTIPSVSTQDQAIPCERPSQTRSILTNPSTTSRRRDITKFFNMLTDSSPSSSISSSTAQVQKLATNLVSTLNETTTIDSSTTMADMATGYNLYRQRYALLHGKSLADYHQQALSLESAMTSDQQNQLSWDTFLFGSKTSRELTVFTKGTYTDIGWVENCLAVMNIKTLQQRSKFQMLMEEHELKCRKPLTIPVQVKISDNTPLYGVLISLDKKEEYVTNDGHGLTDQTYSTITDKLITANGFRVRWRKEPYAHELVVQFTAISDLNGYGPDDFNEILENIGHYIQDQQQQCPGDIGGKTLAPLKKIRPEKVVDYFISMVKGISGSTLANSPDCDWQEILMTFDEETQNRFTHGKTPQPTPVHYLI